MRLRFYNYNMGFVNSAKTLWKAMSFKKQRSGMFNFLWWFRNFPIIRRKIFNYRARCAPLWHWWHWWHWWYWCSRYSKRMNRFSISSFVTDVMQKWSCSIFHINWCFHSCGFLEASIYYKALLSYYLTYGSVLSSQILWLHY